MWTEGRLGWIRTLAILLAAGIGAVVYLLAFGGSPLAVLAGAVLGGLTMAVSIHFARTRGAVAFCMSLLAWILFLVPLLVWSPMQPFLAARWQLPQSPEEVFQAIAHGFVLLFFVIALLAVGITYLRQRHPLLANILLLATVIVLLIIAIGYLTEAFRRISEIRPPWEGNQTVLAYLIEIMRMAVFPA